MKRLNDFYLMEDLLEHFSPDSEVAKWIEQYSKNIALSKKYIEDKMQEIFPKSYIILQGGYDDDLCFFVNIYGVSACEKNNKRKAYDLLDNLENEFTSTSKEVNENGSSKSFYCIIPSFHDIKVTKRYYPEIYEKIIERNPDMAISATNEEIDAEIA
jgi:hypothetical protein